MSSLYIEDKFLLVFGKTTKYSRKLPGHLFADKKLCKLQGRRTMTLPTLQFYFNEYLNISSISARRQFIFFFFLFYSELFLRIKN